MSQLQQTKASTTGSGTTAAVTISPKAAGNLLVVFGGTAQDGATISLSDSPGGHTWNLVTGPLRDTGVDVCAMWWAYALNTSSTTITFSQNGGVQFCNIMMHEFSGIVQSSPVEDSDSAFGTSSTPTSPAVTPTTDYGVLTAFCNDSLTGRAANLAQGADDGASDLGGYRILDGVNGVNQTAGFVGAGGSYNIHVAIFSGEREIAGGRLEDRFRARNSNFWSGTSTLGQKRSAWGDDLRDLGYRIRREDYRTRYF